MLTPLAQHLKTLKRRLVIIGATVTAAFALSFMYAAELIAWFKRPFTDDLIFYGPAEALLASVKISLLAGIVLSLPVILYQCWKFIEPALLPREQRWAIPLFILAAVFFALGLTFCNLVILPLVIQFFVNFGMERSLTPQMAVGTYVDFNVRFLLIFGFAFELPLVMTLLARAEILPATMLSRYRRHAILVAMILSAVVTPDATVFTMLLMAIPLIILYEIGILGARIFGRRPTAGSTRMEAAQFAHVPPSAGTAGKRIK
jgi:sec-independent protein translocase protein TatC